MAEGVRGRGDEAAVPFTRLAKGDAYDAPSRDRPADDTTPLARARAGLDSCVHCGFCLQACPTYLALEDENDSPRGRLVVADRHNHRIQILDKDGKYISEYREFSRVSGITIDKDDNLYAADSESDPQRHPGWLKGIRIGNLKDGKVTMFIPPHKTEAPEGAMGEGIARDAAGNLYTAEATVRGVTKYVRN